MNCISSDTPSPPRSAPDSPVTEGNAGVTRASETPGYSVQMPLTLIGVLPNRRPDRRLRLDGLATELSREGLRGIVQVTSVPQSRHWILGLEDEEYSTFYVSAIAERWTANEGYVETVMRFEDYPGNPISSVSIEPHLGPTGRFELGLEPDVVQAWVELGVVRPSLMHRVFTCPECGAVPVFGEGCGNCGSIQLVASRLIHHFRCAHVGHIDEFLRDSDIVCPKCHARGLVIGSDFENLTGPYTCLECSHSSTELERVGTCLQCGVCFPMGLSGREEVIGYDVDRLDPLAFLGTS